MKSKKQLTEAELQNIAAGMQANRVRSEHAKWKRPPPLMRPLPQPSSMPQRAVRVYLHFEE